MELKIGDKVKINVQEYFWKKDLAPAFKKFLDENIDTIFTIKSFTKYKMLCELKEDSRWLIYTKYLIKFE